MEENNNSLSSSIAFGAENVNADSTYIPEIPKTEKADYKLTPYINPVAENSNEPDYSKMSLSDVVDTLRPKIQKELNAVDADSQFYKPATKNDVYKFNASTNPISRALFGDYTARYNKYLPGADNETLNAQEQGGWSVAGNALGGMLFNAGEAFAGYIGANGRAIDAVVNGDFSKMWDTEFTENQAKDLATASDYFAIYHDNTKPSGLSSYVPFVAGSGEKWGHLAQSFGFTIGTLGGVAVENALWAGLTGGAGNLARAGSTTKGIFDAFRMLSFADKSIDALKGLSMAQKVATKGLYYAKNVNVALNATLSEAAMEGAIASHEFLNDEISKYKEIYGIEPDSAKIKQLKEQREKVGNTTFGLNAPILLASNMFMFGNYMMTGKFFNSSGKLGGKVWRDGVRAELKKGVATNIWRGSKKALGVAPEGIEELSQSIASESAKRHYSLYNSDTGKSFLDTVTATTGDLAKSGRLAEDFLSGAIIGGITMGIGAINDKFRGGAKESEEDMLSEYNATVSENIQGAIAELGNKRITPNQIFGTKEGLAGLNTANKLQAGMEGMNAKAGQIIAAEDKNKKGYYDQYHSGLRAMLYANKIAGVSEITKGIINESIDIIPSDQYAAQYMLSSTTPTEEQIQEHKENKKAEFSRLQDEFDIDFDVVEEKYGNPINKATNPNEWQSWEEVKRDIVFYKQDYRNARERGISLNNSISSGVNKFYEETGIKVEQRDIDVLVSNNERELDIKRIEEEQKMLQLQFKSLDGTIHTEQKDKIALDLAVLSFRKESLIKLMEISARSEKMAENDNAIKKEYQDGVNEWLKKVTGMEFGAENPLMQDISDLLVLESEGKFLLSLHNALMSNGRLMKQYHKRYSTAARKAQKEGLINLQEKNREENGLEKSEAKKEYQLEDNFSPEQIEEMRKELGVENLYEVEKETIQKAIDRLYAEEDSVNSDLISNLEDLRDNAFVAPKEIANAENEAEIQAKLDAVKKEQEAIGKAIENEKQKQAELKALEESKDIALQNEQKSQVNDVENLTSEEEAIKENVKEGEKPIEALNDSLYLQSNESDMSNSIEVNGEIINKGVNKPFETNEKGKNFYNTSDLKFEDSEVYIGSPVAINSPVGMAGTRKMYDEITVSSVKKFPNKVLGEDISNYVYIIDRGKDFESIARFGVSDKVNNITEDAKTYEDAVSLAKTFLSIRERDVNSVLSTDYDSKKVYDFSEQSIKERSIENVIAKPSSLKEVNIGDEITYEGEKYYVASKNKEGNLNLQLIGSKTTASNITLEEIENWKKNENLASQKVSQYGNILSPSEMQIARKLLSRAFPNVIEMTDDEVFKAMNGLKLPIGMMLNGKMWVNSERETLETRMHELGGHVFFLAMKNQYPSLYERLMGQLTDSIQSKSDKDLNEVAKFVKELYPELAENSSQFNEEVMATYMGQIMRDGVAKAIKSKGIKSDIAYWLNYIYERIMNLLGIDNYMSMDKFANNTLGENLVHIGKGILNGRVRSDISTDELAEIMSASPTYMKGITKEWEELKKAIDILPIMPESETKTTIVNIENKTKDDFNEEKDGNFSFLSLYDMGVSIDKVMASEKSYDKDNQIVEKLQKLSEDAVDSNDIVQIFYSNGVRNIITIEEERALNELGVAVFDSAPKESYIRGRIFFYRQKPSDVPIKKVLENVAKLSFSNKKGVHKLLKDGKEIVSTSDLAQKVNNEALLKVKPGDEIAVSIDFDNKWNESIISRLMGGEEINRHDIDTLVLSYKNKKGEILGYVRALNGAFDSKDTKSKRRDRLDGLRREAANLLTNAIKNKELSTERTISLQRELSLESTTEDRKTLIKELIEGAQKVDNIKNLMSLDVFSFNALGTQAIYNETLDEWIPISEFLEKRKASGEQDFQLAYFKLNKNKEWKYFNQKGKELDIHVDNWDRKQAVYLVSPNYQRRAYFNTKEEAEAIDSFEKFQSLDPSTVSTKLNPDNPYLDIRLKVDFGVEAKRERVTSNAEETSLNENGQLSQEQKDSEGNVEVKKEIVYDTKQSTDDVMENNPETIRPLTQQDEEFIYDLIPLYYGLYINNESFIGENRESYRMQEIMTDEMNDGLLSTGLRLTKTVGEMPRKYFKRVIEDYKLLKTGQMNLKSFIFNIVKNKESMDNQILVEGDDLIAPTKAPDGAKIVRIDEMRIDRLGLLYDAKNIYIQHQDTKFFYEFPKKSNSIPIEKQIKNAIRSVMMINGEKLSNFDAFYQEYTHNNIELNVNPTQPINLTRVSASPFTVYKLIANESIANDIKC